MPNLNVRFVGLATLAPISVTKRQAALAILALLTGCASPPPTTPTPGSAPLAVTAPPASGAAEATTAAAPASTVASSTAVPSAATPAASGALDTFSADQRTAFAEARLLLVEGDFASAADK